MKKFLLGLLFVLGASIAAAQTGPDTGIATSLTMSTGVLCSSTVTNTCVQGYTETLTDPTGKVYTILSCSATVTTNCMTPVIGVNSFTFRPNGNLVCGSWSLSAVANWLDPTGKAVASASVSASPIVEPCSFSPIAPSSVSGKVSA